MSSNAARFAAILDMAVVLDHRPAEVSCNRHDCLVTCLTFGKFGDASVALMPILALEAFSGVPEIYSRKMSEET
jgi:hypothetical protein